MPRTRLTANHRLCPPPPPSTAPTAAGNYYCYDNPEALSEQLKKEFADTKYGDKWQSWFALFYSVYSFPNIILPFFGGYLVDKLGVIKMLVIFNVFLVGGQCIFALGGALKSIPVMLAGRVVFGFGGENLTVAQSALMAGWFKNKELAFALGVCLSLSRLGSVANNFLSPLLWEHHRMALWGGAIICGGSLACTLVGEICMCTPVHQPEKAGEGQWTMPHTPSGACLLLVLALTRAACIDDAIPF